MFGFQKNFHGGYLFRDFEGELVSPILEAPIPSKVVIPLRQGFGKETLPLVKVGDAVKAGQMIGASEILSSPVHASINGVVKAITKVPNEHGYPINSIVIEGDETSDFTRISKALPHYYKKKPEEILALLYRSGVTAFGVRGIPTQFRSSAMPLNRVSCVVVKALHTLPFGLTLLLKHRLQHFMNGVGVLHYALKQAPVYVAIHKENKEMIEALRERSKKMPWLHIVPLKPKYPFEHSALLLKHLGVGRKKSGGAVLLETQDVVQVYEAIFEGKPVIDKIVALGGSGYIKNVGIRVRLGTPVGEIVGANIKKEVESQVIVGNFLKDKAATHLAFPLTKGIYQITALTQLEYPEISLTKKFFPFRKKAVANLNGEERPCLSCGACERVCPAKLLPIFLYFLGLQNKDKQAALFGTENCVECGLCSYVCPSKIPVMSEIQRAKRRLRKKED